MGLFIGKNKYIATLRTYLYLNVAKRSMNIFFDYIIYFPWATKCLRLIRKSDFIVCVVVLQIRSKTQLTLT